MSLRPNPAPFDLSGGPVGALLIHGFTGSPPEMRLIGDYLHHRGFTVAAPLLPGHGTTPEDLSRVAWTDWVGHVQAALEDLQDRCEDVFVAGLSGGGLLTLYLAATESNLRGAITYSAAVKLRNPLIRLVPLGKYLMRYFPKQPEHQTDPQAASRMWNYDVWPTFAADELRKLVRQVNRLLPQIRCPLLIVQSTADEHVPPESAAHIYARVASTDKQLLMLHDSGHALTVDSQWEQVAERTHQFMLQQLSDVPSGGEA